VTTANFPESKLATPLADSKNTSLLGSPPQLTKDNSNVWTLSNDADIPADPTVVSAVSKDVIQILREQFPAVETDRISRVVYNAARNFSKGIPSPSASHSTSPVSPNERLHPIIETTLCGNYNRPFKRTPKSYQFGSQCRPSGKPSNDGVD
jgi:hypothetical protein